MRLFRPQRRNNRHVAVPEDNVFMSVELLPTRKRSTDVEVILTFIVVIRRPANLLGEICVSYRVAVKSKQGHKEKLNETIAKLRTVKFAPEFKQTGSCGAQMFDQEKPLTCETCDLWKRELLNTLRMTQAVGKHLTNLYLTGARLSLLSY